MRALIWKYHVNSLTGGYRPNYFQQPQYFDFLNIPEMLYDDFPVYKEQYHDQDGVNGLSSGYFFLNFSLLDPAKSAFASHKVYDFFFNNGNPFREPLFLILVEDGTRMRAGTIRLDQVSVDRHWGEMSLKVEVTGIEKEATDWLDIVNMTAMVTGSNPLLDNYFTNHHFKDIGPLLSFKNEITSIHERVGDSVDVLSDLQNGLFTGGLNQGYSVWSATKSIVKLLGCRWRVDYKNTVPPYPRFEFVLYFRTAGVNGIDEFIYKPIKESYKLPGDKNIFIATCEQINPPVNQTFYKGILIQKNSQIIYENSDGEAFRFNSDGRNGIGINGLGGPLPRVLREGNYTRLDIHLHADAWIAWSFIKNAIYARILYQRAHFGTWRNNEILERITAVEYRHMLAGAKKRFAVENYYNESLTVGTQAIIEAALCSCEEINEASRRTNLQKANWIEV